MNIFRLSRYRVISLMTPRVMGEMYSQTSFIVLMFALLTALHCGIINIEIRTKVTVIACRRLAAADKFSHECNKLFSLSVTTFPYKLEDLPLIL